MNVDNSSNIAVLNQTIDTIWRSLAIQVETKLQVGYYSTDSCVSCWHAACMHALKFV